MKIDLITLHRAQNYGSVLQTYALQCVLEKTFRQEVEILDFEPYRYTNRGLLKKLKYKSSKFKNPFLLLVARILIFPSYIKKNLIFWKYLKKKLNLSDIRFSTSDEAKGKFDDADVFCTGSDQVWNSHWNDGIDKTLFLDFAPKGKLCFSYAASFGLSELPEDEVATTKELLEKYEYISVREDSGIKILESLGRTDGVHVLDPTLLMTKEEWQRESSNKFLGRKYVLTYNLHHDPEIDKYAQTLAEEEGLKVYNISYNWHDIVRKGHLKWCPTVDNFLNLIENATYVVADSFHAVAFSIIFERQFISITPEVASSRITSILNLLGLGDRIVNKFTDTSKIKECVDYKRVKGVLNRERQQSLIYLKRVLETKTFTHNK